MSSGTTSSNFSGIGNFFSKKPYLLLTLTALIWGANAVVGRAAPGYVSPAVLTFGRWGIASIITLAIFWPRLKQEWPLIRSTGWIPLLLGCVGYAFFNLGLYSALQYIPATNAAIYQSGIPLLIFVMNFLLFRQSVKFVEIVGFTLSLIGVAVVVTKGDILALFDNSVGLGELYMFIAAIAYSIYTLGLRFKPQMHWQTFLTLAIVGAAVMSILILLVELNSGNAVFPITVRGWSLVAFAGVLPSIVAQGMYIKGVESVGANKAGLFINFVPLFTALLAVLLISEPFRAYHAIAMLLVIGGVTLAQRK